MIAGAAGSVKPKPSTFNPTYDAVPEPVHVQPKDVSIAWRWGVRIAGDLDGIAPKIHPGQQGKHLPEHNNFISGRSSINSDVNPQLLLDGARSGHYPVVGAGSRG